MPAMAMVHDNDPREALISAFGSIDDIEVFNAQVLVAIYKRPEKTRSGIILADATRDEDKYQGKVGLVLKMGKLAFKDDPERNVFFPDKVSVGDWIVLRVSDGFPCSVNQQDCRLVVDTDIKMRTGRPDAVY